jgi:hypothetical protein
MQFLWRTPTNNRWRVLPLPLGPSALVADETSPVQRFAGSFPEALIMPSPSGFVLLVRAGAPVRVNGRDVGLRTTVTRLEHMDLINVGPRVCLFFSTESLAEIVPFPGIEGGACICARCKTPIAVGEPAISCPRCRAWSHESAKLPCFRYPGSHTCPACPHPNAAGAGYQFNPAAL